MSSYLVDPVTIQLASINTGIDARQIGTLNLKATGWSYNLTPGKVAKQFLGITKREYLNRCEQTISNSDISYEFLASLIDEILYQCAEGSCYLDPIYKQLQQAKDGLS